MKTCAHCYTTKPLEEFGPLKASKDGHNYYCRACGYLIWLKRRRRISEEQTALPTHESKWMLALRDTTPSLYYAIYANRGNFQRHLKTHLPKLHDKIYT